MAVLDEIDGMDSVSFWSIELRIAITQVHYGLEAQKKLSGQLQKLYGRGLLSFTSSALSTRNEPRTTIENFDRSIVQRLNRHRYFESDIKDFLLFKLGVKEPCTRVDLCSLIRVEQSHSLIDIYETFVRVLRIARMKDFEKKAILFIFNDSKEVFSNK